MRTGKLLGTRVAPSHSVIISSRVLILFSHCRLAGLLLFACGVDKFALDLSPGFKNPKDTLLSI